MPLSLSTLGTGGFGGRGPLRTEAVQENPPRPKTLNPMEASRASEMPGGYVQSRHAQFPPFPTHASETNVLMKACR